MGFLYLDTETQLRAKERVESLPAEVAIEAVAMDAPDYAGRVVPCLALVGPGVFLDIAVAEARLADMLTDEGLGGVPRELPSEDSRRLRLDWVERNDPGE